MAAVIDAPAAEPGLTESMVEEEQKLSEEAEKQEEQRAVDRRNEKALAREACLERLKKLLHASNIYSEFLIKRIEKQNAEQREWQQGHLHGTGHKNLQDGTLGELQPSRSSGRLASKKQSSTKPAKLSGRKRKGSPLSSSMRCKSPVLDPTSASSQEEVLSQPSPSKHFYDVDLPSGQPSLFTGGVMKPYQIEGYKWLKVLYENGVNGILADEMGLGKTIQVIALMAGLVARGLPGPYLVVAPLSTLPNWVAELQRFTPSLKVVLYHGCQEERYQMTPHILRSATVVVTSYEVVLRDRSRLASIYWLLLVVDEAHRLKNFKCRLVRELSQFRVFNRLLLTGTPLQNNLTELWGLLHFLIPEIFHDLQAFESWFDIESLSGVDNEEAARFVEREESEHFVTSMQDVLRPFLLRRTKEDVALQLPRRTEVLVYAPLSPLQERLYKVCMECTLEVAAKQKVETTDKESGSSGRLLRSTRKPVKYTEPKENDIFAYYSNDSDDISCDSGVSSSSKEEACDPLEQLRCSRNPLMDMRKLCNHPYLFYGLKEDDGTNGEHLVQACGKLRLLDCMLMELRRRGHKVLIFSQMCCVLNILEDYCRFRKFKYCRLDGNTKLQERQEQMKLFNEDSRPWTAAIALARRGQSSSIGWSHVEPSSSA